EGFANAILGRSRPGFRTAPPGIRRGPRSCRSAERAIRRGTRSSPEGSVQEIGCTWAWQLLRDHEVATCIVQMIVIVTSSAGSKDADLNVRIDSIDSSGSTESGGVLLTCLLSPPTVKIPSPIIRAASLMTLAANEKLEGSTSTELKLPTNRIELGVGVEKTEMSWRRTSWNS